MGVQDIENRGWRTSNKFARLEEDTENKGCLQETRAEVKLGG